MLPLSRMPFSDNTHLKAQLSYNLSEKTSSPFLYVNSSSFQSMEYFIFFVFCFYTYHTLLCQMRQMVIYLWYPPLSQFPPCIIHLLSSTGPVNGSQHTADITSGQGDKKERRQCINFYSRPCRVVRDCPCLFLVKAPGKDEIATYSMWLHTQRKIWNFK